MIPRSSATTTSYSRRSVPTLDVTKLQIDVCVADLQTLEQRHGHRRTT